MHDRFLMAMRALRHLARKWRAAPVALREHFVRPEIVMTGLRRHLLRKIRAKLDRERPGWITESARE